MGISILSGVVLLAIATYQLYQQIARRRRAELSLRQQTERERLINEIAQHIRQSLHLDEVLATTVADVRQFLECDRVLIYQIYADGTGCAITETVLPDYPSILGEVFPEEVFPQEYHQAYLEGKIRAIANIEQAEIESCLVEFVQQFAVKAKLVVPIIQTPADIENPDRTPHLWGLLIAHHCCQPREWQPHEIELMKQLATQVAIAIRQSELYQQLQHLNTQLEERVEQRTEELARTNHALRLEIAERQRSEERFRSLIENALDIITILDRQGNIDYASPSVEKILGYAPTQLIGQNFFDLVHPDDSGKIYQNTIDSPESQDIPLPMEFRARHQDGSWRILEAVTHSDRSASENGMDTSPELRIVVNSRDITARKRLNEVKLALEQEKELHTLKTRFFSMASHEFRTPLSTALAAAQLLEQSSHLNRPEDPIKRSRNLRRIEESIKQTVHLLDDILTINRAEAGKLEFNPQPLDLPHFCRQLLEEIQFSAGHQYSLKFICAENSAWVDLDEKLLRSILSNLLSNAIKYSPVGSDVELRLKFEQQQIVFEICDRGIGIPSEDQQHLFEPFQRGHNVGNIPGTGLGLVVTQKCVQLQGGTIRVDSQINVGTTLTVILPIT